MDKTCRNQTINALVAAKGLAWQPIKHMESKTSAVLEGIFDHQNDLLKLDVEKNVRTNRIQKYDIPSSHFYKYLQFRNFVGQIQKCSHCALPILCWTQFLNLNQARKQTISVIYDLLSMNQFQMIIGTK